MLDNENFEDSKPEYNEINLVNQDIQEYKKVIEEIRIDPKKSMDAFELPEDLEKITNHKEKLFAKLATQYCQQNNQILSNNPYFSDPKRFTQGIYSFLMINSIGQNYGFSYYCYGDPTKEIRPSKELLDERYNLKKQLSQMQEANLIKILGQELADKLVIVVRFYKFLASGGRISTDLDATLLPKLCKMSEKLGFKIPDVEFDKVDNNSNRFVSYLHKVTEFSDEQIDSIIKVILEEI